MATSIPYAFTITLKPVVFKEPAEKQYDRSVNMVMATIRCMLSVHKITMVVELTRAYNIHLHGMIQFSNIKPRQNIAKKFVDAFRNHIIIGYVNITPITDDQGWKDYMGKELEVTMESINRPSIIIDEYGLFKDKHKVFGMLSFDYDHDEQ